MESTNEHNHIPHRLRCSDRARFVQAPGDSTTSTQPAAGKTVTPTQYSVGDFYKNTEYFGASWAPDRQRILVSSNLSGIWNAYAVPTGGGAPQPLTQSTTNSMFALSYFPADERILYSSDEGGNELTHIYVRNTDGSIRDLTPGAKLKANFRGWSGDDKSFFISTNERDERFFDLYEIAADGYKRTQLYRNTDGYELGPVSRDKRFVALVKPRTTSDADIYLHDRQSKTTKIITAHTGTVSNTPADFSVDGSKLLFASDSGREFAALFSYDIASGATVPVYEQNWDILGAEYLESREVPHRLRERGLALLGTCARCRDPRAGAADRNAARDCPRHQRFARRRGVRLLRKRRERA